MQVYVPLGVTAAAAAAEIACCSGSAVDAWLTGGRADGTPEDVGPVLSLLELDVLLERATDCGTTGAGLGMEDTRGTKVSGFWIVIIFIEGETSGAANLASAETGESDFCTAPCVLGMIDALLAKTRSSCACHG
jgi:hypothetical protein